MVQKLCLKRSYQCICKWKNGQSLMQQQQQIAVLVSRFHMLAYVYRRTGAGVAAVQKVL